MSQCVQAQNLRKCRAAVFDEQTIENVQIPKTIAALWGESLAADTDDQYPVLK